MGRPSEREGKANTVAFSETRQHFRVWHIHVKTNPPLQLQSSNQRLKFNLCRPPIADNHQIQLGEIRRDARKCLVSECLGLSNEETPRYSE